ncbi:MAG: DNA mismatch repair protein MutL [Deltaproteobacteria bacterium]|nr:MAG: DNA mismatch repair protein MutL [Deltaproteobacteria bacterium]
MSKIRILPETFSNRIAAGEVVERPASVVKELVENSIDAGSDTIVVDVEQGGRQKIRVYDNGEGMGQEDALLSIERYATSKIKEESDLFSINTLGFRGEALPSIASVSHFSILTKSRLEDYGTMISVKGGKLIDVKEAGAPDGTDIKVSHLFFNTPARRKFLKTVNTEMAHITDILACLALSCPDISFKLIHNGKTLKEWPGGGLYERAVEVLGRDFKNSIYPVSSIYEDINVSGFAASPDVTRSSSDKIYLFVNGRYVKDRSIIYSVYQGYEGRIMKGRYPGCVIFINLPFDKVDVNVHPAKHEVRFADQRDVMACVRMGISEALKKEDRQKWKVGMPSESSDFLSSKSSFGFKKSDNESFSPSENRKKDFNFCINYSSNDIGETRSGINTFYEKKFFEKDFSENENKLINEEISDNKKSSFYSGLRIIGQLYSSYIVCESDEGLILVDQHAAHERIRYEYLLNSYNKSKGASQQLLIPQVIEPNHRESAKLLLMLEEFKKFGLEISHYGGNSFAVHSVPMILGNRDFKPLILDIASMITDLPAAYEIEGAISDVIALMACHGSIRANQKLDLKEISALFESLDKCVNSSRCPHGRPIWIKFDWNLIEKSFKRKI